MTVMVGGQAREFRGMVVEGRASSFRTPIAEEANFFIAGLLYLSCLVTVGNLEAYSIASENRSSVALRSAVLTWTSVGSEMAC
jgi:hypothetical protein